MALPAELNVTPDPYQPIVGGREGAYGTIIYGTRDGQEVTVKIQRATIGEHEASVLAYLHAAGPHPCIVGYIDHKVIGDTSYLLMERCQRELLDDVMDNGRIDEAVARKHMVQLVAAVKWMHDLGVAHRDIKLENIMIRADGTIAIIDVGLAKMDIDPTTLDNDAIGTKAYMAPEICLRGPHNPLAADVWALGVCLFTMCAGFFPFLKALMEEDPRRFGCAQAAQAEGRSTVRAMHELFRREATHLSPEAIALIDKTLTIDKARRIRDAELLSDPWLQAGPPPPSPPLPPTPPPTPSSPELPAPEAPQPPRPSGFQRIAQLAMGALHQITRQDDETSYRSIGEISEDDMKAASGEAMDVEIEAPKLERQRARVVLAMP